MRRSTVHFSVLTLAEVAMRVPTAAAGFSSVRQVVAQREPPVMLRVWSRVERVPDDDASCLALWERCAYPR
jgi:hypothetical protein